MTFITVFRVLMISKMFISFCNNLNKAMNQSYF